MREENMSFMFELYYSTPSNARREAELAKTIAGFGGRLDYREEPTGGSSHSICLTYEFDDLDRAEKAAEWLRKEGEHIEGPVEYASE
jgi:hypothetical protein